MIKNKHLGNVPLENNSSIKKLSPIPDDKILNMFEKLEKIDDAKGINKRVSIIESLNKRYTKQFTVSRRVIGKANA